MFFSNKWYYDDCRRAWTLSFLIFAFKLRGNLPKVTVMTVGLYAEMWTWYLLNTEEECTAWFSINCHSPVRYIEYLGKNWHFACVGIYKQRYVFQVVSLHQLSPAKPQMLFLIFSKEHYLVWSTNHEVPHHPIFPILLLTSPSRPKYLLQHCLLKWCERLCITLIPNKQQNYSSVYFDLCC